ncbi:MAG: polysaccharide biosynthesis/export family protein [Bacteroidales bacterium]|nr:polysaccharide biosynthesis/export family protein [Bacteroidales bacterium]
MKHRFLPIAVAALALWSCSTPKDIVYFQDISNGSEVTVELPADVKIQAGDKLRIIVSTPDQRLSEMFNLQTGAIQTTNITTVANQIGYTVQADGTIDFPEIGNIPVAGLTREQVEVYIRQELIARELVTDPVVVVDYLNMGVSVLGDVNNPGRHSISKDRYTILQAIADAGDLAITGERTNVKVFRQEAGDQKVYEVNLCDAQSLYASPVFYLQQNDVVYVEPNDKRKREATTNGNTLLSYSFYLTCGSFLMSLAVLLFK